MSTTNLADGLSFDILPRDLSAYKAGNTGTPYVHHFDSGKPGPHVGINALTHGNEFCGMVAACALLDAGIRPRVGKLTVSFANVAAYASFTTAAPFDSRQIVHNLNRIWSAEQLNGSERSPELDRAREMRSTFDGMDHLLDIHSTSSPAVPFFVYPERGRNGEVAAALGVPSVHLVMPGGMQTGTPLIQYGGFGAPGFNGAALVVECGQHFERSAGVVATRVALAFLAQFGLLGADEAAEWTLKLAGVDPSKEAKPKLQRFGLISTYVVKTPDFKFAIPLIGFEQFEGGALIATDGDFELRAPKGGCTTIMPARKIVPGREGVYITRALD